MYRQPVELLGILQSADLPQRKNYFSSVFTAPFFKPRAHVAGPGNIFLPCDSKRLAASPVSTSAAAAGVDLSPVHKGTGNPWG